MDYHRQCIQTHRGIWFSQELWLQKSQLSQLNQLGFQFVAKSGMEHATSAGMLRGRPFGGVGIAWSHDLDHVISPVPNCCHKRVVAVELQSENHKFLLISVYMPFYDASNSEQCLAETQDALSMIDLLIENHPFHLIIIGGDLNTELKGESPFDTPWTDMMTRNALASCSSLFSSPGYTYHHETLGHKKLNDHFVLSHSLLNTMTSKRCILDEGSNLSDHLPIILHLNVSVSRTAPKTTFTNSEPKLRWKKLRPSDMSAYSERLSHAVEEMLSWRGDLTGSICTNNCHCNDETCRYFIQQEYDDLISCLKIAEANLTRHKPGCQKDCWTPELSDVKKQSGDIHITQCVES